MNYLTRIDAFLLEHGDVLYIAFLYLSLVLFGFILARQRPGKRRFVVIVLPVVLPPSRTGDQPPVLPPADPAP